jgi:N-acetylglucosamine kinase-like BadF-type ATPase
MDYVLGVDGGASKTFALIADTEGRVLGFAQVGGSNHEGVGFAEAERRLHEVAHQALAQAHASGLAAVGFWGLAGADLLSDYDQLHAIAERIHAAERNIIKNDTVAAMGTGFTRGWGVGVISGTSFNAGGIAPDGREVQFMGMDYATGDWGGAVNIGPEVLRLAHRNYDGRGQPTILAEWVAKALGMASIADVPLQVRANTLDHQLIVQRLPPLLFEAAYEGDEVACELVVRIGEEVGITANAIIGRLGMERLDVEVVLGGSIFRAKGPLLKDVIQARIHRVAPRAEIILSEFDPVVGSVFQALRYLGIEAGPSVRGNIRATLPLELRRDTSG